MIQAAGRLRFQLKAPQTIRVGGERRRQYFDSDIAIETRVPRLIHFAHAARADGGDNLIRSQSRARRQCHGYFKPSTTCSSSSCCRKEYA
jgi:hypothetical protein